MFLISLDELLVVKKDLKNLLVPLELFASSYPLEEQPHSEWLGAGILKGILLYGIHSPQYSVHSRISQEQRTHLMHHLIDHLYTLLHHPQQESYDEHQRFFEMAKNKIIQEPRLHLVQERKGTLLYFPKSPKAKKGYVDLYVYAATALFTFSNHQHLFSAFLHDLVWSDHEPFAKELQRGYELNFSRSASQKKVTDFDYRLLTEQFSAVYFDVKKVLLMEK